MTPSQFAYVLGRLCARHEDLYSFVLSIDQQILVKFTEEFSAIWTEVEKTPKLQEIADMERSKLQ